MLIKCQSCQNEFEILDEEPEIKRRLICPHCLTPFEITWLYPLTLDFVEETSLYPNLSFDNPIN